MVEPRDPVGQMGSIWLIMGVTFQQLKQKAPECIIEFKGYSTKDKSKHSVDASGNSMTRLGYAIIRETVTSIDNVAVELIRRYEILQTCIIPVILGLETTTKEQILLNVNEEGVRETLIIRKPKVVEIPIKVTDIRFDLQEIQFIRDMELVQLSMQFDPTKTEDPPDRTALYQEGPGQEERPRTAESTRIQQHNQTQDYRYCLGPPNVVHYGIGTNFNMDFSCWTQFSPEDTTRWNAPSN